MDPEFRKHLSIIRISSSFWYWQLYAHLLRLPLWKWFGSQHVQSLGVRIYASKNLMPPVHSRRVHSARFSRKSYTRRDSARAILYTLAVSSWFWHVTRGDSQARHETPKPAINLSSNWRDHEKMLAKREKWEVYRWHFVNHLANHFFHLTFRRSRRMISIFMKCQRGR